MQEVVIKGQTCLLWIGYLNSQTEKSRVDEMGKRESTTILCTVGGLLTRFYILPVPD